MKMEIYIDGVRYLNAAVFPFKFENVLDATLDSATITLQRVRKEIFEPLTIITIVVKSNGKLGEESFSTEWLVANDSSEESPVGSGLYRHNLTLIEQTKYGEGSICDSTCITHPGGNIYTANAKPVTPVEE